jgi:hypothetical protein
MFRTHDDNMAGLPEMFGKGLRHWHLLQRYLSMHWYHVTLEQRAEERMLPLVLMANDEHTLQRILSQQGQDIFVKDIQAVTPGWMNESGTWKMEKLTELSTGFDRNDIPVCLLTVESGSVYADVHDPSFDAKSLANVRKIY